MFSSYKVIIKGGGDLASAVAYKLHRSGFPVIITETMHPKMVRRAVSFGNSIYEKTWTVEGVISDYVDSVEQVNDVISRGHIPVLIDPKCKVLKELNPIVLVDAILAKRNTGTSMNDAPIVIGLGPGFMAQKDVHAVIETKRGHDLGKVILNGAAILNTSIPGNIEGYTHERVFRAPKGGFIRANVDIGDMVEKDDIVCFVDGVPVKAKISGIVRGIIHGDLMVKSGQKLGDIDPRKNELYCYTISDKGRTIAGSVLETILCLLNNKFGGERFEAWEQVVASAR